MVGTLWNWQRREWPNFRFEPARLASLEAAFLRKAGEFSGSTRHVSVGDQSELSIQILSDEALSTSEIEGEFLSRDSLQSSLRRNFGIAGDQTSANPAEEGVSRLIFELHRDFDQPLTEGLLFGWHTLLMNGRSDLADVGRYRTDETPMEVISGPLHAPRVHFEAPPSMRLASEMRGFVEWFNSTAPGGTRPLPILTRAGIAHLYFVCIHPFADGNGRLARALAEKAIFEGLNQPILFSLSRTILAHRRDYYSMLEEHNKHAEITGWLEFFAQTMLAAQSHAQSLVEFIISKAKLYNRLRGQLNARQEKTLARMLKAGPAGFTGGLSAENYIRITGASRATATRDLQEMVDRGALRKTGQLKGTRYYLPFPMPAPANGRLFRPHPIPRQFYRFEN